MNQESIVKTSVVWTAPNVGLSGDVQHTGVIHYEDRTYFPWIDSSFRPWVVEIKDDGTTQTIPLDADPTIVIENNSHNKLSIAVDKIGFVHVIGGMHNSQNFITNPRYANAPITYWKSKNANDISTGFDFIGKEYTKIPDGAGWTYPRFFYNSTGTLYLNARVAAIEGQHLPGKMGLGVYQYDETTSTWSTLGDYPPKSREGVYHKVLVWELAGFAPEKWYQAVLSNLTFDKDDKLHLFTPFNSDPTYAGNNSGIYAVSADGGNTWTHRDGTAIAKLPLQATQGLPSSADLVENYDGIPAPIADKNCVVVDAQGNPGYVMYTWKAWNGEKWDANIGLNVNRNVPNGEPGVPVPNYAYGDNKGTIVSIVSGNARICLAKNFQDKPTGHDVKGFKSYFSVDEYSLRRTGDIYGLATNPDTNALAIMKTQVLPASLPEGWTAEDLGPIQPLYSGMSGFLNNEIVSESYGGIIDSTDDSFRYVYKKVTGVNSLVALLNSTYLSAHASLGLMARTSLDSKSLHGFMSVVPGEWQSRITLRNKFNSYKYSQPLVGKTDSLWVKIDCDGNTKSMKMYISADGKDWTLHLNGFIGLETNEDGSYYIGFACQSAHRYGSIRASFSNITLNGQNLQ
jgi:hypothetical protein